MDTLTGRLQREHATLACMTNIYCADHHDNHEGYPCESCSDLLRYAARRLEKCPYGVQKPTCASCPIHCYKPAPRDQVRNIMRYAGPRMTLRHPWRSLQHLADKLRRVEHPMAIRRRRRDRPAALDEHQA